MAGVQSIWIHIGHIHIGYISWDCFEEYRKRRLSPIVHNNVSPFPSDLMEG
jgi:hypothetical protein